MEIIKVYLAGPVQFEEDGGETWRKKAAQIISQATADKDVKVKVFDPTNFFTYDGATHQSDSQVKKYYMDQILHSRVVLVNLTRTNQSPGTAQELQYAVDHEIPIIGFYDPSGEGVYNWLKVDCQCTFTSLLQAVDYLIEYYT